MAIHRAPRLRGNANRLPPLARHEHRFHRSGPLQAACACSSVLLCALCVLCVKFFTFFGAAQTKQIPHRAVRRRKSLLHFRQRDARFFRESLPQRRRKIRNLRYIKFSFSVQRMINLRPAKRRLPQRRAIFAQLFFRFTQQFHWSFVLPERYSQRISERNIQITLFPSLLRYLITSPMNHAIILKQSPLFRIAFGGARCRKNSQPSSSPSPIG